ncbi:MAG: PaaI family thioesterase [Faecalibacterium sp.]
MQEQNIAQMLENPFMQYNHTEIVSVTSDSAGRRRTSGETPPTSTAMYGGAFLLWLTAVLADARSDGRHVTQNAAVNFIHNVKAGHLTARGRRSAAAWHLWVVEITDETDTCCFPALSMYASCRGDALALRTLCVLVGLLQRIPVSGPRPTY